MKSVLFIVYSKKKKDSSVRKILMHRIKYLYHVQHTTENVYAIQH